MTRSASRAAAARRPVHTATPPTSALLRPGALRRTAAARAPALSALLPDISRVSVHPENAPASAWPTPNKRYRIEPASAGRVLRRCGGTTCPPGTCDHDGELRRHSTAPGSATAPPLVHQVLGTTGEQLHPAARSYLEPRFGHDFGTVRVHTDTTAAASAEEVGALAYTVGSHIAFAAGAYAPHTEQGRRLIAHELAHTLQQEVGSRLAVRRQGGEHPFFRCEALGVPCKPMHYFDGRSCLLTDCVPAVTAYLPGAISPGICIYTCPDGTTCVCVLVGSKTRAICTFRFCTTPGQRSAAEDPHTIGLALLDQVRGDVAALGTGDTAAAMAEEASLADKTAATTVAGGSTAQAKLTVGEPDDPLEREADDVADRVMLAPPERRTRGSLEPRLGESLEAVRAHTDSYAAVLARAVSARSFAVGSDLGFAAGEYHPSSHRPYGFPRSRSQHLVLRQAEDGTTAAMPGIQHDDATLDADAPTLMGAEPKVTEDVDVAPDLGEATSGVMQREPSDAGVSPAAVVTDASATAGAAAAAACIQLTWAQFPPANPPGPDAAQTGYTWSNRGGMITVRFDASSSWVRPQWKNNTSAASMALLRHEQYHLTLACELAGKANAAIAAGTSLQTVTAQFRRTLAAQERSYEVDTDHGTVAAMQAAWERDIDAGVPQFPFS